MNSQQSDDSDIEATPGAREESDIVARLDFQRKILERILNAVMVSSNVAREVRTESQNGAEKLSAIVGDIARTSERREGKTQATFDAFQRAFREEITVLRSSISTVLREQAFLQMAGLWLSVLDDVDDLARVSGRNGSEAWSGALQALATRIVSIISTNGLTPLCVSVGETRFDPEQHEGLGPTTPEEVQLSMQMEPGVIVNVHARGFLIGDRIFRCARVVVSPPRATTISTGEV
jgi:molecular chaperone GrpE (heat shock protein)